MPDLAELYATLGTTAFNKTDKAQRRGGFGSMEMALAIGTRLFKSVDIAHAAMSDTVFNDAAGEIRERLASFTALKGLVSAAKTAATVNPPSLRIVRDPVAITADQAFAASFAMFESDRDPDSGVRSFYDASDLLHAASLTAGRLIVAQQEAAFTESVTELQKKIVPLPKF
jgi:hypothetical protein